MHTDSPTLQAIKAQFTGTEVEQIQDAILHNKELGIYCLDLSQINSYPLWLHAYLERVFQAMDSYPRLAIMISGLKQSIRPAGKRWSAKAEREASTLRNYVEAMAQEQRKDKAATELLFL